MNTFPISQDLNFHADVKFCYEMATIEKEHSTGIYTRHFCSRQESGVITLWVTRHAQQLTAQKWVGIKILDPAFGNTRFLDW